MVFFFQAEDGIRDKLVTGVQTCALPIWSPSIRFPSEGDRRSTWNLGKPLLWGRRALSRPCEHRRTTRVSAAGVAGFWVKPELQGALCVDGSGFWGGEGWLGKTVRSEERRVGEEWKSRW